MKGRKAAAWFFGIGAIVKVGVVVGLALAAKSALDPALDHASPVEESVVTPRPASFERIDPLNGQRYEVWSLAVPDRAVLHDHDGAFVYAVDAHGVAHRMRIDIGDRRDGLVEVPWGLASDSQVRIPS